MEFKELMSKARTCRRYQNKPVPMELLMEIIDTARLTPSASNAQPLRYALSTSAEVNARLYPLVRWAPAIDEWDGPVEGERPVAYIVIGADTKSPVPWEMDAGIGALAIQLGLAEKGIGCCIFNHFDAAEVHAAVAFPRYVGVQLVVAVGYPAETAIVEELRKGGPFQYHRDEQGQHYVPKRLLKDIVLKSYE